MSRVAVVTDSTAGFSEAEAAELGLDVVPLQVIVDDECYDDGDPAVLPEALAEALRAKRSVSTSRIPPARMVEAFAAAAADGADEIVSVHLSSALSGTCESAQLAALEAPVPVHVVDSRQVGPGTAFAVRAAVAALAEGEDAESAADRARAVGESTTSLFYVDTLEYLRRGGRIGAAAALVGSALAVKPLLRLDDGRVESLEKVRTAGRALSRLADLAVEAAGDDYVDVTVAHLVSQERAEALAEGLRERLELDEVGCTEIGAVLGAHAGPGMVAVCVAPRPTA